MLENNWSKVDVNSVPEIIVPPPGLLSVKMHGRASELMKGYSSQVRLFPVVFESGKVLNFKVVVYLPSSPI
jgi:hypothetical protein